MSVYLCPSLLFYSRLSLYWPRSEFSGARSGALLRR